MRKSLNINAHLKLAKKSARSIANKVPATARQAVILGSALGDWVKKISGYEIPYENLKAFPKARIQGHKGVMKITPRMIYLCGRSHYYEGLEPAQIIFPVLFLHSLGIKKLILTNAAGSLIQDFTPGDCVFIEDHINLTGVNPLHGADHKADRSPFVDMQDAYSKKWREKIQKEFSLPSGIYAAMAGPNYETPAEITMLKHIGAHMVGMSTVHESIAARYLGMDVLGISCITNMAAGLSNNNISHEEVQIMGNKIQHQLEDIILDIAARGEEI